MSSLSATVSQIDSCDSLHIVKFDLYGETLSMMSLDLQKEVTIGAKVKLLIKPSHIAIGKNFTGDTSYSNRLDATIASIENGALLSSIKLQFKDTHLESIITRNSSDRMDLQAGERVTAFIKASEVSIGALIDD